MNYFELSPKNEKNSIDGLKKQQLQQKENKLIEQIGGMI